MTKILEDEGAFLFQSGKPRPILNMKIKEYQDVVTGYDNAKKIEQRKVVMETYPQFLEEFEKLCDKYNISLNIGDDGGFSMEMEDGYYVDIAGLLYKYRDDLIY
jgi:hypothetical protein